MVGIGLIIYASLFVLSGFSHIRNHQSMVNFTIASLGNCPVAKHVGFLGGAPTGVFLVVAGVAAGFGITAAFYALAGFLAVVTAVFHRNLKDPCNLKTLALFGCTLVLAALVV